METEKTLGRIILERLDKNEKDEFNSLVDNIKRTIELNPGIGNHTFKLPKYHLHEKIKRWLISQDIPPHNSDVTVRQRIYFSFYKNGYELTIFYSRLNMWESKAKKWRYYYYKDKYSFNKIKTYYY